VRSVRRTILQSARRPRFPKVSRRQTRRQWHAQRAGQEHVSGVTDSHRRVNDAGYYPSHHHATNADYYERAILREMSKPTIRTLTEEIRDTIAEIVKEREQLQTELKQVEHRAQEAEAARSEAERSLSEARRALAEAEISSADSAETIQIKFAFPQPVRTACEQYLLYFGEFLRDLGVDSATSIREDAGRVLFEVTPLTPNQALDRIREALEIYLGLPSDDLDDGGSSALAVQRLSANIYHLKSQLALAAAIVKTQQTSIEAQSITIETQRDILQGRILAGVVTAEDSEPILGGVVDLVPLEGKGFRLNLPKLLRDLRARLQK
jgi:hypothetical protein